MAVLISGGGTTLRNLIETKKRGELQAEIAVVIASQPQAGGLKFADTANIPSIVVDHRRHRELADFSETIFNHCRAAQIDLVVMAGFLRRVLIPADFVTRVINIHPSLIPAFCGQGKYGAHVHSAVLDYGCKISGCTVHFVDNEYDHGPIIAQESVPVVDSDTPETLAQRVFQTECQLFPQVINAIAAGRVSINSRQVRWSQ